MYIVQNTECFDDKAKVWFYFKWCQKSCTCCLTQTRTNSEIDFDNLRRAEIHSQTAPARVIYVSQSSVCRELGIEELSKSKKK